MQLFTLSLITMIAFAANSVLGRMGLAVAGMDPVLFGLIRLCAGAMVLAGLAVALRGGLVLGGARRVTGVVSLSVYLFGFSLAYSGLDAGVGALVLFGMVQVTMFAGAVLAREHLPLMRWLGAGVAFAGLAWMMWPGSGLSLPMAQTGLMALAGVGWGVYSLAGRGAGDPLGTTAANFVLAVPIGVVLMLGFGSFAAWTPYGVVLAILSGAVTSGMGYALWYAILPKLGASRAAVAQLTVPVFAIIGGALMLAEFPSVTFMLATVVVLAGVVLSAFAKQKAH
ncbi:MAG: DMT family transporter [Thalassovita sp.]